MTIESISDMHVHAERRVAILALRSELRDSNDEHNMRDLGARLGYEVDNHVVVLDPTVEWPLRTIMRALHDKPDAVVIVPDLQHIDGLDAAVRLMAEIVTVEGERVLKRAQLDSAATPRGQR